MKVLLCNRLENKIEIYSIYLNKFINMTVDNIIQGVSNLAIASNNVEEQEESSNNEEEPTTREPTIQERINVLPNSNWIKEINLED